MRSKVFAAIASIALTTVLATSAAAASPSRAASGYWTECGDRVVIALIITTKAHGVGCRTARRVAKRYAVSGDRRPLGFKCSKPRPDRSGETQRGLCWRGDARVRVVFGI